MRTFEERLFAKIMFNPADLDGCWLWVAATNGDGYGRITRDGRSIYAHRATYELYRGPIPPGREVDHTCHVTRCVNPEHLRISTTKRSEEHTSELQSRE